MKSKAPWRGWMKMLVFVFAVAAPACHVQAIYDDSSLAPTGLEAVCQMPNLPVFNVMNYGATGTGTNHDDTVAIRNAIAAAVATNGGIIYFPAGTYAVCHQPGDPVPYLGTPQIFNITNSSLVFLGEGADKSHISGYMPGLQDPVTHWTNNPDPNAYWKIGRFSMFFLSPNNAPITNVQFRSLEIIGNAGYTGDSEVGGNQTTGDGWDMSHKCIGLVGGQPSDVLIFNCSLNNWRGEIVYGGGNQGKAYIINSHIFSSDASALSISADVLVNHSIVGGTNLNDDVYNGLENFCLGAPQKTVIQDSQIATSSNPTNYHGNGIAYLGLPTSSLLVERSTIYNCNFGVLFSEFGYNVIIRNSTFTNNQQATINSVLGMYSSYTQYDGFADFLIATNTFDRSGAAVCSQYYGNTMTFDNLVLRGNTITHGTVLSGAYDGPLDKPFTGFTVDGNTLGDGGVDADCEETARTGCLLNFASWMNTIRNDTLGTSNGKFWLNCQGMVSNATLTPACDITVVNGHDGAQTVSVSIAAAALPGYPAGFTTTVLNGPNNCHWMLQADSSWNTFPSNLFIGPAGVTIRKNAQGTFDLTTSPAIPSTTVHGIPYTWLMDHGITNTSDSVETVCLNGNGFNVLQDYIAGLDPTNCNSCFSVIITNSAGQIVVSLPTIQAAGSDYLNKTRCYDIEYSTNLTAGAGWQPVSGATGISANGGFISCTNASQDQAKFYRARVRLQ